MRELVSQSNSYMDEADGSIPDTYLLENIARYLSYLLRVFGVIHYEIGIGYPLKGQQTDLVCGILIN